MKAELRKAALIHRHARETANHIKNYIIHSRGLSEETIKLLLDEIREYITIKHRAGAYIRIYYETVGCMNIGLIAFLNKYYGELYTMKGTLPRRLYEAYNT